MSGQEGPHAVDKKGRVFKKDVVPINYHIEL